MSRLARKFIVCVLLVAMLLTFSAVNISGVKADSNTVQLQNQEEFALSLPVSQFNFTAISIGLTTASCNSLFSGINYRGNPQVSGNELGLFDQGKPVSGEQIHTSMSSGIAWMRFIYQGPTNTSDYIIQVSVGLKDDPFGNSSVLINLSLLNMVVISNIVPVNITLSSIVFVLGIVFVIMVTFLIARRER